MHFDAKWCITPHARPAEKGKKFVGVWLEEQDALALGRKVDDEKKKDDKASQSDVLNAALRFRLQEEGYYKRSDEDQDRRRIEDLLAAVNGLTDAERQKLKAAAKAHGCETVSELLRMLLPPKFRKAASHKKKQPPTPND